MNFFFLFLRQSPLPSFWVVLGIVENNNDTVRVCDRHYVGARSFMPMSWTTHLLRWEKSAASFTHGYLITPWVATRMNIFRQPSVRKTSPENLGFTATRSTDPPFCFLSVRHLPTHVRFKSSNDFWPVPPDPEGKSSFYVYV